MSYTAINLFTSRLSTFEKQATLVGDEYRSFLYRGTELPPDFDTRLHYLIDQSTMINEELRAIWQQSETGEMFVSDRASLDKYRLIFSKSIEIIQEVQVKIIEKKKSDLRQASKSLLQCGASYSHHSLGSSNVQDKTESFVRFNGTSSSGTPNNQMNQMMYRESDDSSLDEDELSSVDHPVSSALDVNSLQKAVETMENDIQTSQGQLNMMKEIQEFIARERQESKGANYYQYQFNESRNPSVSGAKLAQQNPNDYEAMDQPAKFNQNEHLQGNSNIGDSYVSMKQDTINPQQIATQKAIKRSKRKLFLGILLVLIVAGLLSLVFII